MAILLAQLGDIHIKTSQDCVVDRGACIGAAISAEINDGVTTVVLAVCGDAAFSGTRTQFQLAEKLFLNIEQEIRSRHSEIAIVRVAVPGNHDCDLSNDQSARNVILSTIKENESLAESILEIIFSPLSEYFDFAERWAGVNAITRAHPFYRTVSVADGDSEIRLHLVNTAWMSSLNEKQGSLHFPLGEIMPPTERANCNIAILHHPTHWFRQPEVMRPLRDRLNQLASVVLVNHEHVSEAAEQIPLFVPDGVAKRTVWMAGGVIQIGDQPNLCNFNLLKIDTDAQQVSPVRLDYQVTIGRPPFFQRTLGNAATISSGPSVGPAGVSLSQWMLDMLDDPGIPISHPHRDPRTPLSLSEIFLYPDLWELDEDHQGEDQRQIRSGRVAEQVLQTPRTLITGAEKSGRTAIAKKLFLAACKNGKVPLLLNGGRMPKTNARLRDVIRKEVEEQYVNLSPDAFEQLLPTDRVLVIDDVHHMAATSGARQTILENLEKQFATVVLCGDDLIKMDELEGRDGRASGLWDYRHVIILPFGEYLREEFVKQWLSIGGDTFESGAQVSHEVDRICELLNVVIQKQLLPPYPFFILIVLQQSDLANASVQTGSFGKLFEGVITAILNRSRFTQISINDKYNYLAALAKQMFDAEAMVLSAASAKRWHNVYWDEKELSFDFDRVVNDLSGLGILTISNEEIRFKYPYFFCFFVAYQLSRTMHAKNTRALVARLSRHLHHRTSADIVLFLVHLTGDPIVLEEMIKTCDGLLADVEPALLESDVEPLNQIGNVIDTISIPDSPDENRRELKLRQDALVAERLAAAKSKQEVTAPEANDDAIKRIFDIHAAFKTIQILGQALRNVAGSADKKQKEEIIQRIVHLSRRILGLYLEVFRDDSLQHVIADIALAHREQQPDLAESHLQREICRHLTGIAQFVCFATIKHTSISVGSQNLAPTVHRVLESESDTMVRLLLLSFDLDRPNAFPKDDALALYKDLDKNKFSASLVRMLVAHHMYLYVVPYQLRQAVCEKLAIELRPSALDLSKKRLT